MFELARDGPDGALFVYLVLRYLGGGRIFLERGWIPRFGLTGL